MICPYCKSPDTKVVDKRDNNDIGTTRRRRECDNCGKRFTTYERVENIIINVVKRDGDLEPFDREKLKHGIMKAVSKRKIPAEKIDHLIEEIELKLLQSSSTEIQAQDIGLMVLEGLKEIDQLGYLLFAAVYNAFEDIDDVKKAIKDLEKTS